LAETYQPFEQNSRDNYYDNLKFLRDLCQELRKPFFLSLPFETYSGRESYRKKVIEMGVPVFQSFERAARAFLNLYEYKKKMDMQKD
jgi:hypothetical protein